MENLTKKEIKEYKKLLPKGSTIYCVLRYANNSGTKRRFDFFRIIKNKFYYISPCIARILNLKFEQGKQGLVVGGGGMDMGFSVIYDLGSTLYNDGYSLKIEHI